MKQPNKQLLPLHPKKNIQNRTPSDDSFSTLGTKETKTVIIEFSNSGKEKEKNESLEAKKKRLEAEYFRTTEEFSQLNNLYKLKRKEYLESNNEEDDNSADELELSLIKDNRKIKGENCVSLKDEIDKINDSIKNPSRDKFITPM